MHEDTTEHTPEVTTEIEERVAHITLNRADQRNSMTRPLLEGLLRALEEVAEQPDVAAVVLTGSGRNFSVGGDLSGGLRRITGGGPVTHQAAELRRFMRSSQLLASMPKPTVAAINGPCAGGALGLVCCADIRLASDRALFTTAFVKAGVSGDFGGTWGLSRAVGPSVARELYLTSRRIDAPTALKIGLVSRVIPHDRLLEEAHSFAVELTQNAPLAVQAIKRLFNALPSSLAEVLEREAHEHARCSNTDDADEARRAFLAKEAPTFHGR